MEAVEISRFGGPDVLTATVRPDLQPTAGQVRIAVGAISVGYQDVMARNGNLASHGVSPGHVPGGEIAGVIDAIGEDVDPEWLGRTVWAFTGLGGGYASQALAPVDEVVPLPDGLSLANAVAIGTAGVVAHFALSHGRFEPGEAVLVRGAGGPLGIAAVQLAAARRASVVGVTASNSERGHVLRRLGATHVLDRSGATVSDDPREFDVVIDVVAGVDAATFMRKLKPGGRMVMIGAVAGPPADLTAMMFANFQRSLTFSTFSANLVPATERRRMTARLLFEASEGKIQTVVADGMPLRRAADAHALLETGGVFGRIVLVPDMASAKTVG